MNPEQARFEMDADDFKAYLSSREARREMDVD
jgi:hypothetical protein